MLNKESQGIHADQEKTWSVAPPSAESISQQATTSDSRDSRICRAAGFRRGCFLWVIESLSARLRRSALRPGQPLGSAEITHAFHPVRGQRFVVLEIKEVSGVEILSLRRSEMGSLAVRREWTPMKPNAQKCRGAAGDPLTGLGQNQDRSAQMMSERALCRHADGQGRRRNPRNRRSLLNFPARCLSSWRA